MLPATCAHQTWAHFSCHPTHSLDVWPAGAFEEVGHFSSHPQLKANLPGTLPASHRYEYTLISSFMSCQFVVLISFCPETIFCFPFFVKNYPISWLLVLLVHCGDQCMCCRLAETHATHQTALHHTWTSLLRHLQVSPQVLAHKQTSQLLGDWWSALPFSVGAWLQTRLSQAWKDQVELRLLESVCALY